YPTNPFLARGHDPRRLAPGARMLQHREYREHRAADRHGSPQAALPVQLDHGSAGRNPRHDSPPCEPGRDVAGRRPLAGHRRGPEAVGVGAAAITMGGNVRVGLEDNFYLEEGLMAKSNGELVEKAARLSRDLGRAVAWIEEARRILVLGRDD